MDLKHNCVVRMLARQNQAGSHSKMKLVADGDGGWKLIFVAANGVVEELAIERHFFADLKHLARH